MIHTLFVLIHINILQKMPGICTKLDVSVGHSDFHKTYNMCKCSNNSVTLNSSKISVVLNTWNTHCNSRRCHTQYNTTSLNNRVTINGRPILVGGSRMTCGDRCTSRNNTLTIN